VEYSQSARHTVEFFVEKQSAQLKTPQAPTSVVDRFANEIGSGAREPDLAPDASCADQVARCQRGYDER
jgi:hypothetical protein